MPTIFENLNDEEKQILNHVKDLHIKSHSIVMELGNIFHNYLKEHKNVQEESYYICHDILYRLYNNLFYFTKHPPHDFNIVLYRLLLRNVFSDLILIFALLTLDNKSIKTYSSRLSLDHDKSMKKAFGLDKEIMSEAPSLGVDPESVQRLVDYFSERIDTTTAELKSLNSNTNKVTISHLHDLIAKDEIIGYPKYLSKILYSPFLALSQTEHYSIAGRRQSILEKNQLCLFDLYAGYVAAAIDILKVVLTERFNFLGKSGCAVGLS